MSDKPRIEPQDVAAFAVRMLQSARPSDLRQLPEKELRRQWHAARTQAAGIKRELERRKTVKKHAREQSTRTRAPG